MSEHSFIVFGAQKSDGDQLILLDIGKAIPHDKRNHNSLSFLLLIATGLLNSDIINERKLIDGKVDNIKYPISYVAYEISYQHYKQFLSQLKTINPDIKAHIPIADSVNNITFEYQPLSAFNESVNGKPSELRLKELAKDRKYLTFRSNCRYAALDIARYTLPKDADTSFSMPTFMLQPFVCPNHVLNGELTEKLYLLPQPPVLTAANQDTYAIKKVLYRRLEEILILNNDTDATRDKFENIKTLYQQVNRNQTMTITELVITIKQWAENNANIIDKHRGMNLFSQVTATRLLVNKIAEGVESNPMNPISAKTSTSSCLYSFFSRHSMCAKAGTAMAIAAIGTAAGYLSLV